MIAKPHRLRGSDSAFSGGPCAASAVHVTLRDFEIGCLSEVSPFFDEMSHSSPPAANTSSDEALKGIPYSDATSSKARHLV